MQPCLGFCFLYFEACWLAGRERVCACGALLPWVVCNEFCLDGYFVVPCYFFLVALQLVMRIQWLVLRR